MSALVESVLGALGILHLGGHHPDEQIDHQVDAKHQETSEVENCNDAPSFGPIAGYEVLRFVVSPSITAPYNYCRTSSVPNYLAS